MQQRKLSASEVAAIRAKEILDRCAMPPVIGAEIGIRIGLLSAALLRAEPQLELLMVDSWAPAEEQTEAYRATGDRNALRTRAVAEKHYRMARAAVAFAGSRARIMRMTSEAAAAQTLDASLDFVFIDADHSYEGCSQDIRLWAPKVRPGGLLCGHDYDHIRPEFHGVNRAVDEAFAANGWTLMKGRNYTWFRAPL